MNPETKVEGDNSGVGSDDEISVIAVIKKGTSGIPKRARYHYIRELPLISVKSLKKSLTEKSNDPRTLSLTPRTPETKKRPTVIELTDEISTMELRRQFNIPENETREDEEPENSTLSRQTGDGSLISAGNDIVHKLPPGTVLIKQEPNTTRTCDAVSRNVSGSSGTGATTATTTTESSNSSSSSSSSSVSSFGSGSGSRSRSAKVKRLHPGPRGSGTKKILDVIPRRNPKRCSLKKGGTVAQIERSVTNATTRRPRERQRLLTTRRQERNETVTEAAGNSNNRTRPATNMPYMNTRSVTRKLYTVGATYQAPTRKDEMEWREWPVHGMHERPVFHPQVGLAAGYAGRVFWATSDGDGMNWRYREILEGGEEVEVVSVDPESKGAGEPRSPLGGSPRVVSENGSFDVCMHESLHCVLAYCAQIMAPEYRRSVGIKQRRGVDASFGEQTDSASALRPHDPEELGLPELEDSAISDETLMEMSSIYKKLLPAEDQPSSRENSRPTSAKASPSPRNKNPVVNLIGGYSTVPNNPSEASEIARILSEYNESLKEPGVGQFDSSISNAASIAVEKRTSGERETRLSKIGTTSTTVEPLQIPGTQNRDGNWLEELLVDTSLLYCVANGVDQRDLTRYVDSLDSKQSLQWLRRRDG